MTDALLVHAFFGTSGQGLGLVLETVALTPDAALPPAGVATDVQDGVIVRRLLGRNECLSPALQNVSRVL